MWVEGREYVRAPDGRLLIDMDGFEKWALGEQRWAAQMGHSSTRMFFETYARWMQDADNGVQRQAMADAFTSVQINERVQCKT